ncbi:MAG TPA: RNB domain-containing ribonuclease, partial [Byssovorax sp.]
IRSHARLSYDGVAAYLANGAIDGVPEGVRPTVRWLRTAAARLGAVRVARGGVSLAREEASVSLDPNTHEPLDVTPRAENDAHRLVERLMVAANEAVAEWLVDRGLPGLFRVHEQPTPERVAMLTAFAENFGIETGFGPELTPRGLAAFEAQYRGTSLEPAMASVVGRTLGSARYTVHPAPHFGLAAPLYLHFTSPIRRYADLVVHRVVKRYLAGERDMSAGDLTFEAIAEHVNRVAFAASKAETERHRMLVARLFAHRIGEAVGGRIVSVQPFGLVVQIDGTGATGTVAIDALPGAPHRIDLARQEIVGGAATYAVGQPFAAKISATNEDLGRVDLVPA